MHMHAGLTIADRHAHQSDRATLADRRMVEIAVDVALRATHPRGQRAHEARLFCLLQIPRRLQIEIADDAQVVPPHCTVERLLFQYRRSRTSARLASNVRFGLKADQSSRSHASPRLVPEKTSRRAVPASPSDVTCRCG